MAMILAVRGSIIFCNKKSGGLSMLAREYNTLANHLGHRPKIVPHKDLSIKNKGLLKDFDSGKPLEKGEFEAGKVYLGDMFYNGKVLIAIPHWYIREITDKDTLNQKTIVDVIDPVTAEVKQVEI